MKFVFKKDTYTQYPQWPWLAYYVEGNVGYLCARNVSYRGVKLYVKQAYCDFATTATGITGFEQLQAMIKGYQKDFKESKFPITINLSVVKSSNEP